MRPCRKSARRALETDFVGQRTRRRIWILGQQHNLTTAALLDYLEGAFGLDAADALAAIKLYLSGAPASKTCCSRAFWAAEHAYSDNQFFCFARFAAAKWAPGAARLYFWDYLPSNGGSPFFTHAQDIPYWMGVETLLPGKEAAAVSRSVSTLFAAFIREDDEVLDEAWPSFPASLRVMRANAIVRDGERKPQCDFWARR